MMRGTRGTAPMIATQRQLDEAVLAAVTGGTGPLDPLLYTGEDSTVIDPVIPDDGPRLTATGEGTATAEALPVP